MCAKPRLIYCGSVRLSGRQLLGVGWAACAICGGGGGGGGWWGPLGGQKSYPNCPAPQRKVWFGLVGRRTSGERSGIRRGNQVLNSFPSGFWRIRRIFHLDFPETFVVDCGHQEAPPHKKEEGTGSNKGGGGSRVGRAARKVCFSPRLLLLLRHQRLSTKKPKEANIFLFVRGGKATKANVWGRRRRTGEE